MFSRRVGINRSQSFTSLGCFRKYPRYCHNLVVFLRMVAENFLTFSNISGLKFLVWERVNRRNMSVILNLESIMRDLFAHRNGLVLKKTVTNPNYGLSNTN